MATRRPLVLASGVVSELFPGDTVFGAQAGVLTAGSGLAGGGDLSTNQRIDVSLVSNPSGLIFVGNQLGIDGVAQSTATTALASGNAALSRAGGTMTGQIIFANGQQINSAVNLSGGVSGAVPYQSAPNATTFLNPGVSGQVLSTQGSNQSPAWITPAGGKILQVVSNTYNSSTTTTNGGYITTPLSGVITPSSTSSKVLICGNYVLTGNLGAGVLAMSTLYRGATEIREVWATYNGTQAGFSYVDSPSTTSTTQYAIYYKASPGGGNPVTFNGGVGGSPVASIVLLEVGP